MIIEENVAMEGEERQNELHGLSHNSTKKKRSSGGRREAE